MSRSIHTEQHSTTQELVRDSVIGLADGLTVPFALAAGLAGASISSAIIVTAGLAEIAAGSIAMGLGGYLAARNDAEHYANERKREAAEVAEVPEEEAWEVEEILGQYGVTREESRPVVDALRRDPTKWTDFMMRFELGLESPIRGRAFRSAATIAIAYVVGGLIPLLPYILIPAARSALLASTALTTIALVIFGIIKSRLSGAPVVASTTKTLLIGAAAAAAAYVIARIIS